VEQQRTAPRSQAKKVFWLGPLFSAVMSQSWQGPDGLLLAFILEGDAEGKGCSRACEDPCASSGFTRFMMDCQQSEQVQIGDRIEPSRTKMRHEQDWRPDRALTAQPLFCETNNMQLLLMTVAANDDEHKWIHTAVKKPLRTDVILERHGNDGSKRCLHDAAKLQGFFLCEFQDQPRVQPVEHVVSLK
jgi:hypothetical protein